MIVVHINPSGVEKVYFQSSSNLVRRPLFVGLANGPRGPESPSPYAEKGRSEGPGNGREGGL